MDGISVFKVTTVPSLVTIDGSAYKVFHLSRNHVVKKSHDCVGRIPQHKDTTLLSLVVIGVAKVQDIRFFIFLLPRGQKVI